MQDNISIRSAWRLAGGCSPCLSLALLLLTGLGSSPSFAQTCGTLSMPGPIQQTTASHKNAPTEPLAIDLAVLRGLAPVTVLAKTYAGAAALGANYSATGALASGAMRQATLLPFPAQQQQDLRAMRNTQRERT